MRRALRGTPTERPRAAAALAWVLPLAYLCAASPPDEPWKRISASVESGLRERVAKHARWDGKGSACKPEPAARLELVEAPAHGRVEFGREQRRPGGCDRKVPHAVAYYTSEPGYVGSDAFRYLRINPENGVRRLVAVEIAVEPAASPLPGLPGAAARPRVQPVSARDAWSCPAPCRHFQVVFTGDVYLGDDASELLAKRGYAHAFAGLRPLLTADRVVGNVDSAISARTKPAHPEQRWSYASDPRSAAALREVGFSALGLANNHAFDRGPEGLRDTLAHLERAGLVGFGAGADEAAAVRPFWIETPFGRVAVVAMTTPTLHAPDASKGRPGVAVATPERIARVAREARTAGARVLVAYVGWGKNYRGITAQQRALARVFAEAGFDLVVGQNPHVAQQVERLGRTLVLYSLGNFAFTTPGRFDDLDLPGYGLVARAFVGRTGLEAVELRCILTDNQVVKYQTRPCADDQAGALLGELGGGVALRGDVGVLVAR